VRKRRDRALSARTRSSDRTSGPTHERERRTTTGNDGRQEKDRLHLARDDLIQATGTVDKILGGGRYQITLENGQQVTAQLSGRMRRFRIRVIPGDRVTVGLSPYDPTHGFITFRLKDGPSGPGGPA
jgi:translation initiation factor IF-1